MIEIVVTAVVMALGIALIIWISPRRSGYGAGTSDGGGGGHPGGGDGGDC